MAETFRVLITGSREFDDYTTVCHEIGGVLKRQIAEGDRRQVVVVHGGARGADTLAERAAHAFGMTAEAHPAEWRPGGQFDRSAGFRRNAEMITLGADLCIAFYKQGAGNKGTDHCARQAEAAGIPVRRVTDG